jgi:hypothetical protein
LQEINDCINSSPDDIDPSAGTFTSM